MSALPVFRADVVGSLLRADSLKGVRQRVANNTLSAQQVRQLEDEAVQQCVHCQQAAGFSVLTDGEQRRAWWHFDFFEGIEGIEGYDAEGGIQFNGVQTKARNVRVVGKLKFGQHPFLKDYETLHTLAGKATAKITIPSPSVLHFRGGRQVVSPEIYPNLDDFFKDLTQVYRDALAAFYQLGCRYLQLDDTVWAYLCSEEQKALIRERGEDPEALARTYARVLNDILHDKPADLQIGLHVCRGNFRSTWISSGGYEPVAELLFGQVKVDNFLLEYDSDRAGGFEPLRFIKPGHQKVVLGLITTKTGEREDPELIKGRIFEAAKFVPLDQLCLSTQCGFASTEEGNALSPAEQQAKLELVTEVAKAVWG